MPQQLPLNLPTRAALGRHDFLVAAPNATALAMIEDWQNWPGQKLILQGPEGAGKTHLAHVWAALSDARILTLADIADVLKAPMEPGICVVVEDADQMTGRPDALHLLALHNMLREVGGWLMITTTKPLSGWSLDLADLKSRLQAAPVTQLEDPDDQLLFGLLLKLFDDRQLNVDPTVITFLASRIERSFATAQKLVERIDTEALAQKRAITRPFVAEILSENGG